MYRRKTLMKKRTVKAVLAAAMAAATVIGGAAPTAAARAAETDSAGTESGIELIPVPKEMTMRIRRSSWESRMTKFLLLTRQRKGLE